MITRIRTYSYDIDYDGHRSLTVIDTVSMPEVKTIRTIRQHRKVKTLHQIRKLIRVLQRIELNVNFEIDANGWSANVVTHHTVSRCLSVSP